MSIIGRPEILRVRHQGCEIAFHSRKIELLEFSTIVEIGRHGIGSVVVLAKDLEADRFGPPILIGSTITRVQIGALGCTHDYLFDVFSSWVKFSPRFYFMSFAVFRHDFTFLNSHSCFLTQSPCHFTDEDRIFEMQRFSFSHLSVIVQVAIWLPFGFFICYLSSYPQLFISPLIAFLTL